MQCGAREQLSGNIEHYVMGISEYSQQGCNQKDKGYTVQLGRANG
ncbi:hypothetical protein XSR1_350034 [Xenorhabdus szentirmaii DSM 16338]|uniref:Uncharacterized protein n=1 Tax=Xenorhabdus szentirmaii DSM 16338 TaxID=1427518 RepID=W1J2K8_9GAMM|nr:hypothetical protein XSR1_350034 [Xenorhabdus szentirmaii DSM 16338]